jgi:hypothetical protein
MQPISIFLIFFYFLAWHRPSCSPGLVALFLLQSVEAAAAAAVLRRAPPHSLISGLYLRWESELPHRLSLSPPRSRGVMVHHWLPECLPSPTASRLACLIKGAPNPLLYYATLLLPPFGMCPTPYMPHIELHWLSSSSFIAWSSQPPRRLHSPKVRTAASPSLFPSYFIFCPSSTICIFDFYLSPFHPPFLFTLFPRHVYLFHHCM